MQSQINLIKITGGKNNYKSYILFFSSDALIGLIFLIQLAPHPRMYAARENSLIYWNKC